MTTTIKDFGRHSEKFGDIAFYYAFPIKFWFGQSMLVPEDVLSWCRENCTGYYKVVCYTHEDSVRNKAGKFDEKIMYVDKIYLNSEDDAAIIKLTFDVREQQVKRPRLRKERAPRVRKVVNPTSPEAIAEATRKHAAKMAKKATRASKKAAKNNTNQLPLI